LIGKAFSAARINERSGRIQQVADDLVDAIVAAESGKFPLKAAFARLGTASSGSSSSGDSNDLTKVHAWSSNRQNIF